MKLFGLFALVFAVLSTGKVNAKELTYQQFLESCKNPASFGHQNPPSKIKLLCSNTFTGWQPMESGMIKLQESRVITGEVISDKHHVSSQDFFLQVPESNATCPRFREVVERATIEIALTCDQVLNEETTIDEKCRVGLDEAINENPDIVEAQATGSTYSVCGDVAQKE